MSEGKFSKPWQVGAKIIEWFFFTIHILHFMTDSNSRKITGRVWKIHKWIQQNVYE